jgi:hypothetical protein
MARLQPAAVQPPESILKLFDFRRSFVEKDAGNWVSIPHDWEQRAESCGLQPFITAHRRRHCLIENVKLRLDFGDTVIRITNDDVESLGVPSCPICRPR